jgi:hypothetical protein
MKNDLNIQKIGERTICIGGIGKMFYQEGFPISIAVSTLKEHEIEVSVLHVADECLKHGWSPDTTYNKLVDEFADDVNKHHIDLKLIRKFVDADYDNQREMIFEYLGKEPITNMVKHLTTT